MAPDYSCPHCKSDATQRLATVHEAGLTTIDTASKSLGAGTGGGSHSIGLGTIHTRTKGTAQTVQSKNASPPPKQPYLIPLVLIFVGYILLSILVSWSTILHGIVVVLWIGACVAWVGYALRWNLREWPKEVAAWRKLFICGRCDHVFRVDPSEQSVS